MQWRAKAIGVHSAAAEAHLEDAGPYEKMTLRKAMSTVLKVLEDVLGDDFSVDSVEMVCANASCAHDDRQTEVALETGDDGNAVEDTPRGRPNLFRRVGRSEMCTLLAEGKQGENGDEES